MTQIIPLSAELRDRAGKGTARQTRRSGRIPAVIYGDKQAPVMVTLETRAFTRILHQPGFFTHLFDVNVGEASHRVLARDVQFHPVTDVPLHVDFLRVSADTKITVSVPVEFVGHEKSPGIKRGGVLNIVAHEIELTCAADSIPEHIVVSLEGVDLGVSIHIGALKLPEGAVPTTHGHDFTVASIAAPSGLRSEEAEAAAAPAAEGAAS